MRPTMGDFTSDPIFPLIPSHPGAGSWHRKDVDFCGQEFKTVT